jgi:diadenosine tetraphosphate (Ap4A) HIT family hydrolase
MNRPACPFCNLPQERVFLENATTLALLDTHAVAEGQTLVIFKRHVASIFVLPLEES